MPSIKRIPLLLSLIFTISSCIPDESRLDAITGNYLVFGHYYGFCQGKDCIAIFLLTSDALYEDTRDVLPGSDRLYQGDFKKRSQADFESVKHLQNLMPTALLLTETHVIGAPDAADGGGFYVEYKYGSTHQFWLIDKMRNNSPTDIHPFLDSLDAGLTRLLR
jgi:hypothetical protein